MVSIRLEKVLKQCNLGIDTLKMYFIPRTKQSLNRLYEHLILNCMYLIYNQLIFEFVTTVFFLNEISFQSLQDIKI